MLDKTLTKFLSNLENGTKIRHVENFNNIKRISHDNEYYWISIGKMNTLFLHKEELCKLEPFVKYCMYIKIRGKTGFYHCEENGLFNTYIQFNTLSQFAKENIKNVYPKFNTTIHTTDYLEYYCKKNNQWIKLGNYSI
jgi:hypothetical protein